MEYPENIMRMVRGSLGLEPDDTSRDGEIERMSNREVLDRVCNWEGLIGYSSTILGWISQIYGVDLDKINI